MNHNDAGNTGDSNYILHSKKKKIKIAMNHNDAGNTMYSNYNILHSEKRKKKKKEEETSYEP